jgi:TetR/AcrR family transcriptional regulator, transcriptional repressor for nem operon
MGCLMVNTGMELAPRDVQVGDVIAHGQRALEDLFTEALEAGRGRKELPAKLDCRAVGRFLVGTLFGVTVLMKNDPRSPAARAMVDVALQALAR